MDVLTGKPLAGALVSTVMPQDWHVRSNSPPRNLLPAGSQRLQPAPKAPGPNEQRTTDANGRFSFSPTPYKYSSFFVSKPGYLAPNSSGSSIATFSVNVMPGIGELRFPLSPEAEVSGKVSSSEGTALPNLMVTLYRVQYAAGRSFWIYFDKQRTEASGSYRFVDLPAGTYFAVSQWLLDHDPLPIDATNCNDRGFLPQGGYAPEAEPGVLDFQKAQPIRLTEGKRVLADLKLQHQLFYPVTIPTDPKLNPGQIGIVDRNGRSLEIPVGPDTHCIRSLQPYGDRQQRTINLPSGSYTFERRAAFSLDDPFEKGGAKQPVFLGGYAPVTVAGKPVLVTLPAIPEGAVPPLQMRLHREAARNPDTAAEDRCSVQGPAIGGVGAHGSEKPLRVYVKFVSVDSFAGEASTLRETQKEDDLLEVQGLKPGRYWVQTQVREQGFVSALTVKGINLMQHPLYVGMDRTTAPVDITIRDDCGKIHFEKPWTPPPPGAILADPVGIVGPYYELLVAPSMGNPPQFSDERALIEPGRAASVTLGNLAPGHYKIFQTLDEHTAANFSAGELEQRLGPGRDVLLKPGETVKVEIHDPPR